MMKILYESATLESTTRLDGGKFWRIKAYKDASGVFTQTESWKSTKTGESKHIFSTPCRIEAKNVGRSNESTPEDQAIFDAGSDVRKKLDSGYWPQGEGPSEDALPLPMLAMSGTFEDNKHYLAYPCAVQPKYDGHRMLFDATAGKGWTRKGKLVIAECIKHLKFDTGGVILDGELMLPHDEYGFEAGTSAAKKFDPELSPHLVMEVYDLVDEKATFEERHARLKKMAKKFPKNVRLAETRTANSEEEVLRAHGEFVQQGHEGGIARNWSGIYRLKDRSHDLVKVKMMQEDEFVIDGCEEGEGKFEGCATFIVKTKAGEPCGKATPKGSLPEKRAYFKRRKELLGKLVTVQFQGWTPDKQLRFPVAIRLREDL